MGRGPVGTGEVGTGGADPGDDEALDVRVVHPFEARKAYLCPGCQQEVPAGTGHVVVVPRADPSRRRHWHRACWTHRHRRRPGR